METKVNILKLKIKIAYCERDNKIPKTPTIDTALKIFREIKKMDRAVIGGEVDYKKELFSAKEDLELIFQIPKEEIQQMTKNNLYMKHQSLMVNAIYELLMKGEL